MSEFAEDRYERMSYQRCGASGLRLPAISLGCWHNFGGEADLEVARRMLRRAFDLGITHFDLANNYGPPPGSAEENVGRFLAEDFAAHRDELIISTKAGFRMWPGPYGDRGSRKYLLASLDQSLQRLGLDYVDLYYHHRPDPETPLEETLGALEQAVRSGKAIYAGISNYDGGRTAEAAALADRMNLPLVINQHNYSMFNRGLETSAGPVCGRTGLGVIAFCPLAQGLLTDKYLQGIPEDSRAATPKTFLRPDRVTEEAVMKVRQLNELAADRGQSMAQMALAWVLRHDYVSSALIGASKVQQVEDSAAAIEKLAFTDEELSRIDAILTG